MNNISPKKMYGGQISTWKSIRHCLPLRKVEIKNTSHCHYTAIRKTEIKRLAIQGVGEVVEQLENSCTTGGSVK